MWSLFGSATGMLGKSLVKKNTEQTSAAEAADVSSHAPGRRALSK